MDQQHGHESLVAVAGTVTLEEVNDIVAEVLEFISDFGEPTSPPPAAIVACVPKRVHIDGVGETELQISPNEISSAIRKDLEEPIDSKPELEVPKDLITLPQLQELISQCMASFVTLDPEVNMTKLYDEETGIMQCRLSNGIPVNYMVDTPFV